MPYQVVARQGGSAPSRYDAIVLVATKQMQRAAKRGKDLRRKHGRGGTRKALNMANRILSGQDIHPDNVRDMFAFFERFSAEAQKQRGTEKWDTASDRVGPLRIAWDLWGGDSGRAWARRKRNQLDAADKRKRRHHHHCGPVQRMVRTSADTLPGVYWRRWLDSVQRPTERQIRAQWRTGKSGIFPQQVARYNDRIARVLGGTRSISRSISDEELRAILMDDVEVAIVQEQFAAQTIERGVRRSYAVVARLLMEESEFDPTLDPTYQIIAEMIADVQQVTKDRVAKVVRAGLADGVAVGELQRTLIRDHAFSPARALTIARTETARTVSQGQEMAFNQAANIGVVFEKEWVTSQDDAVRESHKELDGERVQPGEPFDTISGASGEGPGLFFDPAEDINCRCVVRPVNIRG